MLIAQCSNYHTYFFAPLQSPYIGEFDQKKIITVRPIKLKVQEDLLDLSYDFKQSISTLCSVQCTRQIFPFHSFLGFAMVREVGRLPASWEQKLFLQILTRRLVTIYNFFYLKPKIDNHEIFSGIALAGLLAHILAQSDPQKTPGFIRRISVWFWTEQCFSSIGNVFQTSVTLLLQISKNTIFTKKCYIHNNCLFVICF